MCIAGAGEQATEVVREVLRFVRLIGRLRVHDSHLGVPSLLIAHAAGAGVDAGAGAGAGDVVLCCRPVAAAVAVAAATKLLRQSCCC